MLCKTRAGLVPLKLSSAMARYLITTSIYDALNDGDSLLLLFRQGYGVHMRSASVRVSFSFR